MEWSQQDPGAGELGGLTDLAVWLRSAALSLTGAGGGVRDAAQALRVGWSGQAADAWADRADLLVASVDPLPGQLDAAATAVMAYVGQVEEIKSRAARARDEIDEHQRAVDVAQQVYDDARARHLTASHAWGGPGSLTPAPGLDPDETAFELRRASRVLDDALVGLGLARASLQGLADERGSADEVLVTLLDRVQPAGWDAGTANLMAGLPSGSQATDAWVAGFAGWVGSLPDTVSGRQALREAVSWLTDEQYRALLASHPGVLVGLLAPVDLSWDPTYSGLYAAAARVT